MQPTERDPRLIISIHAPHARSDDADTLFNAIEKYISIHAPHARSDGRRRPGGRRCEISIHAPHARSDEIAGDEKIHTSNFNPRSSCEERRALSNHARYRRPISIHAPHARSDVGASGD